MYRGTAYVMLHSGGERRSVIGGDFGKKVRVERWIEIKGSRENERGGMPKKPNKELSVETSESRVSG